MRRRTGLILAGAAAVLAALGVAAVQSRQSDDPPPEEAVAAPETTTSTTAAPTTTVGPVPTGSEWRALLEPGVGGRLTSLAIDPSDPNNVLVGGDLLGIGYSDDGGETWTRASGLLSLEVSRFTFVPDAPGTVWVGTMSGPHVSTDGGRTWTPMRNGLPEISNSTYTAPIEVVLVDRERPGRLLAFGGSHREWPSLGEPAWGAVWESTDGGENWSQATVIAGGGVVVTAAAQLGGGVWLASTVDGSVWRSVDDGYTWEWSGDGLPHNNVRDLATTSTGEVVYAALAEGPNVDGVHLPGGIWRSVDGGVTWEARSEGLGSQATPDVEHTSRYDAVAVSAVDPETLWTADLAFGIEAVYRSDDGGETWAVEPIENGGSLPATAYATPPTAEALAVDTEANELRFVAQSEYVLRRDGDGTWVDATASPAGDGFVGTGYSGLVATDVAFGPDGLGHLLLSALDGGQLLVTRDNGASWTRPLVEWDPWGGGQAVDITGPAGEHTYVLLGQFGRFNGVAVSHDGQATWSFHHGAEAGLPERLQEVGDLADLVADPANPDRVAASIGGTLYLSTDGGTGWSTVSTGREGDPSVATLAAAADGTIYAADAEGVVAIDPQGVITPIDGSPGQVDDLVVDDATGGLFAVRWAPEFSGNGGLHRWDGSSWTELCVDGCGDGLDLYVRSLAVDPFDPNHLVVVTNDLPFHDRVESGGVLESTDGGATWQPINDGLPILRVATVAFDPFQEGRIVIGTFGGGFYQLAREP